MLRQAESEQEPASTRGVWPKDGCLGWVAEEDRVGARQDHDKHEYQKPVMSQALRQKLAPLSPVAAREC